MSSKIGEKNLDYIQTIKPDIEDVEIKANKRSVKQVLQTILLFLILESSGGQIKVECMFDNENSSFIKVCIRSDETLIDNNEINRLNKIFSKSEQNSPRGDKSNLLIIKELVESLKGRISISSDKEKEVAITFVFIIDINIDVSFEKAGDVSD